VLWTHFTASRVSLKKPEPSFGLVDWRERERASSCAGSRGGVEGGLSELEVLDIGGMEGSAYQAAPALWRYEPMMNGGETWRSPISRDLRSSHAVSRHLRWPERARVYRVDVVEYLALRSSLKVLVAFAPCYVCDVSNLRRANPRIHPPASPEYSGGEEYTVPNAQKINTIARTQYRASHIPFPHRTGALTSLERFSALPRGRPGEGGWFVNFYTILEVVSRRCGRFSVGSRGITRSECL